METIINVSSATTLTGLLVIIFKFAYPTASGKLIAAMAFICGQMSALLVAMAAETPMIGRRAIATIIITGILCTAAAMGIHSGDTSADDKRIATS